MNRALRHRAMLGRCITCSVELYIVITSDILRLATACKVSRKRLSLTGSALEICREEVGQFWSHPFSFSILRLEIFSVNHEHLLDRSGCARNVMCHAQSAWTEKHASFIYVRDMSMHCA